MPFLPPSQQRQSTEGINKSVGWLQDEWPLFKPSQCKRHWCANTNTTGTLISTRRWSRLVPQTWSTARLLRKGTLFPLIAIEIWNYVMVASSDLFFCHKQQKCRGICSSWFTTSHRCARYCRQSLVENFLSVSINGSQLSCGTRWYLRFVGHCWIHGMLCLVEGYVINCTLFIHLFVCVPELVTHHWEQCCFHCKSGSVSQIWGPIYKISHDLS